MKRSSLALLASVGFALACGGSETEPAREPSFPSDYATSYTEVYDCRQSGDHDLNMVRMLADPAALEPYRDRSASFPPGAVVLKEEYEFGDLSCEGSIRQWTVMVRAEAGEAEDTLGWIWEKVDAERRVDDDPNRCVNCHRGCGNPPEGFEGTCTIP